MVKNLPAMQEAQVRFLGWEDPPEKGMVTHPSIFACRIPWTEELGGLQSWGHKESDTPEHIYSFIIHSFVHSFILLGPTSLTPTLLPCKGPLG